MIFDYNFVVAADEDEFRRNKVPDEELEARFTKSDVEDIRKIERLLDVQPGTLDDNIGPGFYVGRASCSNCSRVLTAYDFVFTGLVDAGHPKSFILHTLVGSKLIIQPNRQIRCSSCGNLSKDPLPYGMWDKYFCGG
jgi:hypothetical protein